MVEWFLRRCASGAAPKMRLQYEMGAVR